MLSLMLCSSHIEGTNKVSARYLKTANNEIEIVSCIYSLFSYFTAYYSKMKHSNMYSRVVTEIDVYLSISPSPSVRIYIHAYTCHIL